MSEPAVMVGVEHGTVLAYRDRLEAVAPRHLDGRRLDERDGLVWCDGAVFPAGDRRESLALAAEVARVRLTYFGGTP